MFERLNRRMEILADQIKRDKERQGQPNCGLTVPSAAELWQAKQTEKKPADFSDIRSPGAGITPCVQDRGEPQSVQTDPWLRNG
jgi:hypothetical protein